MEEGLGLKGANRKKKIGGKISKIRKKSDFFFFFHFFFFDWKFGTTLELTLNLFKTINRLGLILGSNHFQQKNFLIFFFFCDLPIFKLF